MLSETLRSPVVKGHETPRAEPERLDEVGRPYQTFQLSDQEGASEVRLTACVSPADHRLRWNFVGIEKSLAAEKKERSHSEMDQLRREVALLEKRVAAACDLAAHDDRRGDDDDSDDDEGEEERDPLLALADHLVGDYKAPRKLDPHRSTAWIRKHSVRLAAALPRALELASRARGEPLHHALSFHLIRFVRAEHREGLHRGPLTSLAIALGHAKWVEKGGTELEGLLRGPNPPIALLDADWILRVAKTDHPPSPSPSSFPSYYPPRVLSRRQRMPSEAFISLESLSSTMHLNHTGLPIIMVSMAWLTPDHPDPLGANLQRLARVLAPYVAGLGRWGVFVDYACLHQEHTGSGHSGQRRYWRTPTEEALFQQGVRGVPLLFSHPNITVFRLTSFPKGYPERYDLPDDANRAEYSRRGWCFAESLFSSLVKSPGLNLDIGRCLEQHEEEEEEEEEAMAANEEQQERKWWTPRGDDPNEATLEYRQGIVVRAANAKGEKASRQPPLLPEAFRVALQVKSFTKPEEDLPLLVSLYEDAFTTRICPVRELRFGGLLWRDYEVIHLANTLKFRGGLKKLEMLDLKGNRITDVGALALADVLPLCKGLKYVSLSNNRIGFSGMEALAAAKNALPGVIMNLWDNPAPPKSISLTESELATPRAAMRRVNDFLAQEASRRERMHEEQLIEYYARRQPKGQEIVRHFGRASRAERQKRYDPVQEQIALSPFIQARVDALAGKSLRPRAAEKVMMSETLSELRAVGEQRIAEHPMLRRS